MTTLILVTSLVKNMRKLSLILSRRHHNFFHWVVLSKYVIDSTVGIYLLPISRKCWIGLAKFATTTKKIYSAILKKSVKPNDS